MEPYTLFPVAPMVHRGDLTSRDTAATFGDYGSTILEVSETGFPMQSDILGLARSSDSIQWVGNDAAMPDSSIAGPGLNGFPLEGDFPESSSIRLVYAYDPNYDIAPSYNNNHR
jgi:hypothetical protein